MRPRKRNENQTSQAFGYDSPRPFSGKRSKRVKITPKSSAESARSVSLVEETAERPRLGDEKIPSTGRRRGDWEKRKTHIG